MRPLAALRRGWSGLSLRRQATIWSASLLVATTGLLLLAVNVMASATGPNVSSGGIRPVMTPAPGQPPPTTDSLDAIVRETDRDTVKRVRLFSIVAFVVVVAAGSAGTYCVTGLILKRVGQYTAMTGAVDQDNLHMRLPDSADELGQLAKAINSMMERIEVAFAHHDRFSEQLVHQLGNRIANIKASVDYLSDQGFEDVELQSLTRNTQLLVDIIEELSRIQEKASLESIGCVPLPDLVCDIVEELSEAADTAVVSLNTQGVLPDHQVRGNRDALKIALTNVIDNAIAYSQVGGEVVIRTAEVGGMVAIVVEDGGIGIARDDIGRVFDVAFRGQNACARRPRGAGLGLAITAYLVRRQGGAVEVQSLPGRGTDVTLTLPISIG